MGAKPRWCAESVVRCGATWVDPWKVLGAGEVPKTGRVSPWLALVSHG